MCDCVMLRCKLQQNLLSSLGVVMNVLRKSTMCTQFLDLENIFTLENFLIKKGSLMQPTGSTSFDTPQQ